MGKATEVQTDLSLEELEEAYRTASDPLVQRRAHVVLLRARGIAPFKVAEIVCLATPTISSYIRRFNEQGLDFFLDRRTQNAGRAPLLDEDGLALLEKTLESPPDDGGRWSGPKVTRWLEAHLGKEPNTLSNTRGWEALKALDYSYKSSRPHHVNAASDEEREQWKKKS